MADEPRDNPPGEPDPTIDAPKDASTRESAPGLGAVAGDAVGPFKIIRVLGEGGFGVVYLAEQTEPVKRRVALKVIKPGMDTKSVIARFEAERQALAMMDFAGIAKVFEAGATPEGRPYFAMEFVKGEPINTYCDRHRLDTRARLELFARVCDAIQHAHQKGVIHRDLKPGNILVTIDARDEPQPKVIDFGIAKATAQPLTEKTLFTEQGQLIGTPEYMSPEQAEMSAVDVDTRSDVYSLGVILYELLSGQLPFDPKTLRSKGFAEIQRIIREEDPPKPSTKLTTTASEEGTRIAQARDTKLAELQSTLRRELEWIPLKALRKERTQRYSSAEDLGADVRRYLNGEPLEAGPESASYRFRKLVRRNKGPFIAAVLIGLALIAGIIGTTIFAVQAARQAELAESNAKEAEDQSRLAKSKTEEVTQQRDKALKEIYFAKIRAISRWLTLGDGGFEQIHGDLAEAERLWNRVHPSKPPFELQYFRSRAEDASVIPFMDSGPYWNVLFSPDGDFVIAVGMDSTVHVWNSMPSLRIRSTQYPEQLIPLSFNPDGTVLMKKRGGDAYVDWDVAAGNVAGPWKYRVDVTRDQPDLRTVGMSSRRIVAQGEDDVLFVFDAFTGERLATLYGHTGSVSASRFNTDGSRMASQGSDSFIRVWDTDHGVELESIFVPREKGDLAGISPDGSRILTVRDGVAHLRDMEGKVLMSHREDDQSYINSADALDYAFSPDGSLLAIALTQGRSTHLFDSLTGRELEIFPGVWGNPSFTPDGKQLCLCGPFNDAVYLLDMLPREDLLALHDYPKRMFDILFSPDGKLMVDHDGTAIHVEGMTFWDVRTGDELGTIEVESHGASAFNSDGSKLAVASRSAIHIFEMETGLERSSLFIPLDPRMDDLGRDPWIGDIAFSPDGTRIAMAGDWPYVLVFDVASGDVVERVDVPKLGTLHALAFSSDGSKLAFGGVSHDASFAPNPIWICDLDQESGHPLWTLPGHRFGVWSLEFLQDSWGSHDGRLLSAGLDAIIRLWDWEVEQEIRNVPMLDKNPNSRVIVSGQSRILTCGDVVHIHDLESLHEIATLNVPEVGGHLACSPDGSLLAILTEDDTVLFFDARSRQGIAGERRAARQRAATLQPLVTQWMEHADSDRGIVLEMLEQETHSRTSDEIAVLRNLVFKAFQPQRDADFSSRRPDRFRSKIHQAGNNADTLNSLAWVTATSDDKAFFNAVSDDVLRAGQRACELTDYENAACLDTLARVHFERGELADALKWQEVAVEHIGSGEDEMSYLEALARYRAAVAGEAEAAEEPAASAAPSVP